MRCRFPSLSFAVVTVALGAFPLAAAPLTPETKAVYDKAVTEYDLGHYKDALVDFEKVYTLQHVPALLFNIAQCHRLLGELKEAAAVYRSFISRDPQSSRVDQARALLDQVEAALARQEEAQLPKAPEPQASAAPGTTMIPAQPSPTEELHLVEPPAPARAIAPAAAPNPAPPQAVSGSRAGSSASASAEARPRIWTWVAAGGAAVATGVGAALGAKSASTKSSLADSLHSSAEVQSLQLQEASDAHRANSFFVAGGALAAVAVACFVLRF